MNERYQRITQALNILKLVINIHQTFLVRRQRTSARAFITYPKIIFADEPTGALDSKNTRDLLQRFQKSMNFITQR